MCECKLSSVVSNYSLLCLHFTPQLEEFVAAKEYLIAALDMAKELKDITQESILLANMGLIYLREGLTQQAKESCALAYRLGKTNNIPEAIEQAEYCLNEIKGFTK